MNSMTGYASMSFELGDCTFLIEIKSLNNKFLDIRFKLPSYLEHMEEGLKRLVRGEVSRGKIEILIRVAAKEAMELKLVQELLGRYMKIIGALAEEYGDKIQVSLQELLALKSLFNSTAYSVGRFEQQAVEKMFIPVLRKFCDSRSREGELALRDIEKYVGLIVGSLEEITKVYPEVQKRYAGQLRKKIEDLIDGGIDETRLMTEVAIFANKVDISEELSRIKGHIAGMRSTLKSGSPCGRELDFISQEMLRETNTIGAKVPDYTVAEQVVQIKTNIERIKEQVRNIE